MLVANTRKVKRNPRDHWLVPRVALLWEHWQQLLPPIFGQTSRRPENDSKGVDLEVSRLAIRPDSLLIQKIGRLKRNYWQICQGDFQSCHRLQAPHPKQKRRCRQSAWGLTWKNKLESLGFKAIESQRLILMSFCQTIRGLCLPRWAPQCACSLHMKVPNPASVADKAKPQAGFHTYVRVAQIAAAVFAVSLR